MTVLMEGLTFTECARWHDGRFWFADWAAGQVIALDASGGHEVVVTVPSLPLCFDFLPDGRMVLADSAERRLLRREADGALVAYADLAPESEKPWNEIVLTASGDAYVNTIGFDFPDGDYAPGFVVHVAPDGVVRRVADDLAFPNGMAITADGSTLIVAESYANQLTAYDIGEGGDLTDRRVWAATGEDHPDGICLDAEGASWYADVGTRRCVRVREGGEVLGSVELDVGAFSCAVSTEDEPRLLAVGQSFDDQDATGPTGRVVVFPAPAPGLTRAAP